MEIPDEHKKKKLLEIKSKYYGDNVILDEYLARSEDMEEFELLLAAGVHEYGDTHKVLRAMQARVFKMYTDYFNSGVHKEETEVQKPVQENNEIKYAMVVNEDVCESCQ